MVEWSSSPSPLTALLGPTNTGKTHRAVERMLQHRSGMIGLPLRLLAREVYDRMSIAVGERAVALVTGEEKRIPARPRYWVCTVEAMPIGREVDFLAVDEIQLATHSERGHVFTDRLLHARGRLETWFMGAETVRCLVERLLCTARIENHPRLSLLRYAGKNSLARLPPRSAVVVFSAPQVYELAERLRRRKGGAAVVLGALSPRTRNAQVALFQSGEVDYLVATDAIGMGLNMQVEHVALGALRKFDGRELRPLEAAELAQIAGRAGRYQSDGTFGILEPLSPLPAAVISALEHHRFPPERHLVWRNSELDFSTLDDLVASLRAKPPRPELRLVARAIDAEALLHLGRQPAIRQSAGHPERVALLWEVCQIPDFGHFLVEHHCQLLAEVFHALVGPRGRLDPDWMQRRIARLDQTEGDLDALVMRLESIRTWSYISHHSRWVEQAAEWQARTEQLEERLSDALHARLVERFVERGRGTPRRLLTSPTPSGSLQSLAALRAWCEQPSAPIGTGRHWAEEVTEASHQEFVITSSGTVSWRGEPIGRLTRGKDLRYPEVRWVSDPSLPVGTRLMAERRLLAFTRDLLDELLGPLRRFEETTLSGAGRGLIYQLEQGLGTVARSAARAQLDALTPLDRRSLRQHGVWLGRSVVYLSPSLRPRALLIRKAILAAYLGQPSPLQEPTPPSVEVDPRVATETYLALGYPVAGSRAIRADLLERVERRLWQLGRGGSFVLPRELSQWLGCKARELPELLVALGYGRCHPKQVAVARGNPSRSLGKRIEPLPSPARSRWRMSGSSVPGDSP